MATLHVTVREVWSILRANIRLPESIRVVRADDNGLLVTVRGGITVQVRPQAFADGILHLSVASKNWLFKFADSMGRVDPMLDAALRDMPFVRRQGKSIAIDLNRALQRHIQGVRVNEMELRGGLLRIDLQAPEPGRSGAGPGKGPPPAGVEQTGY
jgi:hypothetical protein